jgi:predicted aspartyl protease
MKNNLPPIGMCGKTPSIPEVPKVLLAHTPYDGEQRIAGRLSEYNTPVIPIRFIKGNEKTVWMNALIDTGSYYSLAKPDVLKHAKADFMFTSCASSPEHGTVEERVYSSAFQIEGVAVGFSTLFMEMNGDFMYNVILGAHIFEIADLHIFGKENRFELIFK